MKKIIAILAATAALTSAVFAQADEDALSVNVDLSYKSKYVYRGLLRNKDSLQTDLSLSYQTFDLGLWTQNSMRASQKDSFKMRIYGDAGTQLDDSIYGSIGFNVHHSPNKDYLGSDQTTFEPLLKFAFDLEDTIYVKPTLIIAYDVDLKDWTFEAGVGHAIELADQVDLELGAAFGYRVIDKSKNYIYGTATANVVYAVKDPIDLYAGISGSFNDLAKSHRGTASDAEFWFGVGVRAAF